MYKTIPLDYTLNLDQRLALTHTLPLSTYTPSQLELVANYILYADGVKSSRKYIQRKEEPLSTVINQPPSTATYTQPKLPIDLSNPFIAQYQEAVELIKQQIPLTPFPSQYKLKRWLIELRLDMGLINSLYHNPIQSTTTWGAECPPDLNSLVDLSNSFHIAKILQFYSKLRESDSSKFWMDYIDSLIEKSELYPWQKHILIRRIDGASHITIGVELAEKFNKTVTPSTISQAMRTVYRQIAMRAEQEEWEFFQRDYPPAWRKCPQCGEKKTIKFGYYPSKPHKCKQCIAAAKGSKTKRKETSNAKM